MAKENSLALSVSLQTASTQGPYTFRYAGLVQAHLTSWGSQPLAPRAVEVQLFWKGLRKLVSHVGKGVALCRLGDP